MRRRCGRRTGRAPLCDGYRESDVEAFAAAAAVLDVRVVELEAFVQSFAREVELGAVEVRQALGVDDNGNPVALEAHVIGPDLVRILELVREPRAAGGAHAESQADALAALRK